MTNTLKRAQNARFTRFTFINVAVSPVGLAVYYLSTRLGLATLLGFIAMSSATTLITYPAHRKKSFSEDDLRWRTNLRRWSVLRAVSFVVGLAVVSSLTSIELSWISVELQGLCAVVVNGVLQAPVNYKISKHWALAPSAEVQEATA